MSSVWGSLYTWTTNLLLVGMVGTMLFQTFMPASFWMEAKKLYVSDAVVGESPHVNVDFSFNSTFILHWHTEVRRSPTDKQSDFDVFCQSDGQVATYPGREMPHSMNIAYWLRPTKCDLPVGTYYVETTWSWQQWLITRDLTLQSNIFHVRPGGSP